MSRSGDVENRENVPIVGQMRYHRNSLLLRTQQLNLGEQVRSKNTRRWYAGKFLMVNPNPDPPVAEPAPQFSNLLASRLDLQARKSIANKGGMEALLLALGRQEEVIREGGGAKAVEAQHGKKRLTARERLVLLLDPGEDFLELGLFAAFGMYEEWGGAAAAGVVTGLGRVAGRLVMVIANDATVKAGAFFPMTAKKVLRAQTIAMENRIPTLYLVDSSGVFLPLQEDVFPDQDDFGRIFRNNAVMSAQGIPADHGDYGHVRGRWGISSGHDRSRADDRGQRAFSRRAGTGAGGDRPEVLRRRAGRGYHARGNLGHGRFQRAERPYVPGQAAIAGVPARPRPGGAVRPCAL